MATASETRQVPKAALCFDAGPLEFAAADDGRPGEAPIQMLLRSAQPITHWYWGRIVHDMQGMQLRKPQCPVDYCHNYDEIVGVLHSFQAGPTGLVVAGKLITVKADDRADELIKKGRAGIPYEASLDWSGPGARIEEIGEGVTVQVNGFAFEGPGYVVREWPLRAAAICPYGADPNTKTEFAALAKEESVTILKEHAMSQTQTSPPAPPAAGAKDTPTPRDQFTAELKRFTDRFGADGATWLAAGKTWEQALEARVEQLTAALTAKDQQLEELRQKLAQVDRGERTPATFEDDEQRPGGKKQLASLIRIKR